MPPSPHFLGAWPRAIVRWWLWLVDVENLMGERKSIAANAFVVCHLSCSATTTLAACDLLSPV